MQLDYYRSPRPEDTQAYGDTPASDHIPPSPPSNEKRPRRRRRGRLVLAAFLLLILLAAGALITLRVLHPDGWKLSWDQLFQQIPEIEFFFEHSDKSDFPFGGSVFPFDDSDFPSNDYNQQAATSSSATTIPRAPLAPGIQMELTNLSSKILSFQEVYEKVIPSIVSIQCYGDFSASEGTGVIMTSDGYVVTNHHIISGCSYADVVLSDGSSYEAKLVGSDAESDLAVLKVDASGLIPAEFGISDSLRVGDDVLAIGNPLGSELFGTMTEGIVSAINRDVNVDGYTMTLIQTTAALNPGNSGGALINMSGQVIGITNMKMMSDYNTIEGLGFAIPTVWAKEVVDTLLAEGNITGRPTIGFTCFTVPEEYASHYGHVGVCIETVTNGGPAAKAGVQPDDIVIEANGRTITSLEDLTLVRDEVGVGGTMELTIWRNGEIVELTLVLVDQYELN